MQQYQTGCTDAPAMAVMHLSPAGQVEIASPDHGAPSPSSSDTHFSSVNSSML